MQPLQVPVPPQLEAALGYAGEARYVAFYWTPAGDEAVFDDGRHSGDGHWHGYLAFTRHPAVALELARYNLGSSDGEADHWLVLDRQGRKLSVAPTPEASRFVREQWPQGEPVTLSQEDLDAIWEAFRREMEARPMPTQEEVMAAVWRQHQIESEMVRWLDQTPEAGRGRKRIHDLLGEGGGNGPCPG